MPPGKYPKEKECETFKGLWESSLGANPDGSKYPLVERAALLTDKGLLVMPTSGRISEMHSSNGVVTFTPTGAEYSASTTSSRFDIAGGFFMSSDGNLPYKTFDGEVFRVYATIHTHPNTVLGNPQRPSTSDKGDYRCRAYGIEQYILGAEGITEYNNDGSVGVKFTPAQLSNCIVSLFTY